LLLLVLTSGGGLFYWWEHSRVYVSTDNVYVVGNITPIASEVGGQVVTLYINVYVVGNITPIASEF
jgi:membrane fusion protein (multidrug efflux system)